MGTEVKERKDSWFDDHEHKFYTDEELKLTPPPDPAQYFASAIFAVAVLAVLVIVFTR